MAKWTPSDVFACLAFLVSLPCAIYSYQSNQASKEATRIAREAIQPQIRVVWDASPRLLRDPLTGKDSIVIFYTVSFANTGSKLVSLSRYGQVQPMISLFDEKRPEADLSLAQSLVNIPSDFRYEFASLEDITKFRTDTSEIPIPLNTKLEPGVPDIKVKFALMAFVTSLPTNGPIRLKIDIPFHYSDGTAWTLREIIKIER